MPNPVVEGPITDVVVTANRRNQRERDVAGSVTGVTGEDLTRRQQVRVQDLVGQVPGLSVQDSTPTQVRIVLRGINAGGSGATVGTVIDDVPVNAASSQVNGSLITPNLDTFDLQRVEVLRGPQSSLYGATAEGGLIKYVTNLPDLNTYSGSFEGGLSGLTAGGLGGSQKVYVNAPLIPGKIAIRLTGASEQVPGYISNSLRGKTDSNSGQQLSWRASLLAKPTSDLTVRLTALRQSTFSNANNQVQVTGAAANPLTSSRSQFNRLNPLQRNTALTSSSQLENSLAYGQVEYNPGIATFTSLTSYGYNKLQFNNDITDFNLAAGVPFSQGLIQPLFGVAGLAGQRQNSNTSKFNQEVRVSSNPGSQLFGRGFDWQVGGFYTNESVSQRQFLDARSPTAPFGVLAGPQLGGSQIDARYSEWAAFGQVTIYIIPSLSLDLGGRYTQNNQRSQFLTFGDVAFGPTSVRPRIDASDSAALYTIAPKWQIDANTLAYSRIATGYRPGGPNIPVPGITGVPLQYTSDRTTNYEVGLRRDFFNKTVQVDVTGFYVDWKRIQILSVFQTTAGPFGSIGNAGSAVSKGVEWSFNWRTPVPGLRFGVVGAYTDARLGVNAPGLGGRKGDYLPYVPNVTNAFNVDYFWEPIPDYQAYVSGTATYIGERFTDFSSSPAQNNHTSLPGYATGSIRAGLERGRFSGEVFINNISDARGITTYANNGGANQTGLATLIQPRLIGAVLRAKF